VIRKLAPLAPAGLFVAGVGFLAAAAWAVALPLGLAVIGVGLLAVEYAVTR